MKFFSHVLRAIHPFSWMMIVIWPLTTAMFVAGLVPWYSYVGGTAVVAITVIVQVGHDWKYHDDDDEENVMTWRKLLWHLRVLLGPAFILLLYYVGILPEVEAMILFLFSFSFVWLIENFIEQYNDYDFDEKD